MATKVIYRTILDLLDSGDCEFYTLISLAREYGIDGVAAAAAVYGLQGSNRIGFDARSQKYYSR